MVCASEGDLYFTSPKQKPMTNTELTLDQLTAIAGGVKKMTFAEQIEWIKRPWCFPLPTDNDWPGEWPGQDENAQ